MRAAAFLQAVLEAPDEDWPRQAFADWLIEHGQPERGEFIQVQCELAKLTVAFRSCHAPGSPARQDEWRHAFSDSCGCEFCSRRRRERELLLGIPSRRPNWIDFTGPALWEVIPDGASYTDHIEFRRGFVEAVTCTALAWHQHGAAIRAFTPLRAVTLSDYLVTNVQGVHGDHSGQRVGSWDVTLFVRPFTLIDRPDSWPWTDVYPWCDLSTLATWDVSVRAYPTGMNDLVQRRGQPVRLDVSPDGLSIPCIKGRIRVVIDAP